MRKLSFWAHEHIWTTRLLLFFIIYPLFNLTGWILGSALYAEGFSISRAWAYPLSLVTFILIAFYYTNREKRSYAGTRIIHLLLVLTSFGFILITGTRHTGEEMTKTNADYNYFVRASETVPIKPSVKKQKKGVNRLLDKLRKKYQKADNGTKAVLIILTILVAIGLTLLVGALACSIACSSSEALGYIVFFLGFASIIFGAVKIIHRISKGPKKKTEPASTM